MSVEYLDLADYIAIAAEVTGLDIATIMKVASLDLADSAARTGRGTVQTDFYPGSSSKRRPCSLSDW